MDGWLERDGWKDGWPVGGLTGWMLVHGCFMSLCMHGWKYVCTHVRPCVCLSVCLTRSV